MADEYKSCLDCKHCATPDKRTDAVMLYARCLRDRPYRGMSYVEAVNWSAPYCEAERTAGTIIDWLYGSCGKRARFFKSR